MTNKKMARKKYIGFALSENLMKIVDEKILKNNVQGFRSRAEFITAAVREYLKQF